MPKIIENIREKLLTEVMRQVREQGYSSMTIRSVASACGVGIGTVYNYFPSKDMLVASFMLEDWMHGIDMISEGSAKAEKVEDALYCMYQEILYYKEKYESLFTDENAKAAYVNSFMQRHRLRWMLSLFF